MLDVTPHAARLATKHSLTLHPVNLGVRFVLEIVAFVAFGMWGWHVAGDSPLRWALAGALPVVAALVWGIPAAANDVGRSATGPLMVSGHVRLLVETFVFVAATVVLYAAGFAVLATVFAVVAVVQCALSFDRIMLLWLGE